jgi:hypothetical protein
VTTILSLVACICASSVSTGRFENCQLLTTRPAAATCGPAVCCCAPPVAPRVCKCRPQSNSPPASVPPKQESQFDLTWTTLLMAHLGIEQGEANRAANLFHCSELPRPAGPSFQACIASGGFRQRSRHHCAPAEKNHSASCACLAHRSAVHCS